MFSGCVDTSDKKLQQESSLIEKSGNSIFLGFELDVNLETEGAPPVVESEHSSPNKSAAPSVASVESDQGLGIEHLWTFQCPMTKGYNVTSMDWNKSNRVGRVSVVIVAETEFIGVCQDVEVVGYRL